VGEASDEDKRVVYEKIRNAACYFKGDSVFSSNLWKSFESAELDPTEFKELLKSNFDIYLSPNELDAAIKLFDTDGNGDISSIEFITTFFRIALKERSIKLEEKRRRDEEIIAAKEDRIRVLKEEQVKKNKTKIIWPVLPDPEYQRDADGKLKTDDSSGTLPAVNPKRKVLSKPSMSAILSPAKSGTKLKKGASLASLYPSASESTRDFIMELEHQEREVRKLRPSTVYANVGKPKKGKKSKKKQQKDFTPTGNLEDADWGASGYYDDNNSSNPNMLAGDNDFGTRPGTSANSNRNESRGTRPNTGLTGFDGPASSTSIVEEVGDVSTEDVTEEVM
jgi:hypothetical protein